MKHLHSIAPIDYFVLIAGYLKAFSLLLVADDSNVGQPLLPCKDKRALVTSDCEVKCTEMIEFSD